MLTSLTRLLLHMGRNEVVYSNHYDILEADVLEGEYT
jgi:hypothetical protein